MQKVISKATPLTKLRKQLNFKQIIVIHNNAFKVDTDRSRIICHQLWGRWVEQNTVTITSNTIETAGDATHDFEKAIIIGHATQTSLATLTITGNTIKDSDTGIELLKSQAQLILLVQT